MDPPLLATWLTTVLTQLTACRTQQLARQARRGRGAPLARPLACGAGCSRAWLNVTTGMPLGTAGTGSDTSAGPAAAGSAGG
jgi:hypothetical protein